MKKKNGIVCYKNPKISYILQKTLVLSIICCKCDSKDKKIFKEKESIEVLTILDEISNIKKFQKIWLKKHKSRI